MNASTISTQPQPTTGEDQLLPAVIPVAGSGSRLRPVTQHIAKELLPLGRDVVLTHILDELEEAGVPRVVLIGRPDKPAIKAYVETVRERYPFPIELVDQGPVRGNGGAILTGAQVLGQGNFLVVWGDEVFIGPARAAQLLSAHRRHGSPVICLTSVEPAQVGKCGMARTTPIGPDLHHIHGLFEKPTEWSGPNRLASVGGFVLDSDIIELLTQIEPRAEDGELYLSSALDEYSRQNRLFGIEIEAAWHETGSFDGYVRAFATIARANGLISDDLLDELKGTEITQ